MKTTVRHYDHTRDYERVGQFPYAIEQLTMAIWRGFDHEELL